MAPLKNYLNYAFDCYYYYSQNILEWDLMPTDWSIVEIDLVRKIKTKLYGNPRYVEFIDDSNKKSHDTTEHSIAPSLILNNNYTEGGEEDNINHSENITYKDIVSLNESNEDFEIVNQSYTLLEYNFDIVIVQHVFI